MKKTGIPEYFWHFFHIETKIELIYQCTFVYTGNRMLDLCRCVLRIEQQKDRERQENSNFCCRFYAQVL